MSTMCRKKKKYLDKDKEKYVEYLSTPQYMCGNCGRLANSSKNLCKPIALENYLDNKKSQNIENEIVEISEAEYQFWQRNILPFGWFIIN